MLAEQNINFMGVRKQLALTSAACVLVALVSLLFNSLQFGLDFTSGTSVRLSYEDAANVEQINEALIDNGYQDALVVTFGSVSDVRVLLPIDESIEADNQAEQAALLGEEIAAVLSATSGQNITLLGSDYVSAKVGAELAENGGMGLLVALGIIMVYISVRFQFKFSVGAVVALAHDVLIVLGIFSLFKMEFNLTVLAALLAIIGYSLNDTIVVSDRIRENFRRMRKGTPEEMVNVSLNQTFGRTIITSFTTLIVLVSMYLIGGESLQGFSLALIIGVLVGTYSSMFVASNVILYMNVTREDLMIPVKEDNELDDTP